MSPANLGTLLRLAWPIVITRATQVVIGFCDAAMVSPLGEPALAATTTGALNSFTFLILPMGTVFIVSSFASQLFGRGDLQGARRYALYGFVVALFAELLCLLGAWLAPTVLAHFGYTPEVRALMAQYLGARLLTGGAAIGFEVLSNYYGGIGNTRLPMMGSVLAMVLNVALSWLLIRGHLGAPALGVLGTGVAAALATFAAFAFLLGCFVRGVGAPESDLDAPRRPLRLVELARMLRFGLPSGLNWFFEFLAFTFFVNVIVAGLGTTGLAALMAVMQVNSLSFMPAFGLATAGSILVGQAIGAKQKDDVPALVWLTLRVTAVWQGLVGCSYLVAPTLLLSAFARPGDDASRFLDIGKRMLVASAAWQLFDAAANTLGESLRAAGDTAFSLWARLALAWLVFLPGAWLSVRVLGLGEMGAVASMAAYIGLLAVVLGARFQGGRWRRFDLAGHEGEIALEEVSREPAPRDRIGS
jgi:MATE family multidrug resistance protein